MLLLQLPRKNVPDRHFVDLRHSFPYGFAVRARVPFVISFAAVLAVFARSALLLYRTVCRFVRCRSVSVRSFLVSNVSVDFEAHIANAHIVVVCVTHCDLYAGCGCCCCTVIGRRGQQTYFIGLNGRCGVIYIESNFITIDQFVGKNRCGVQTCGKSWQF